MTGAIVKCNRSSGGTEAQNSLGKKRFKGESVCGHRSEKGPEEKADRKGGDRKKRNIE